MELVAAFTVYAGGGVTLVEVVVLDVEVVVLEDVVELVLDVELLRDVEVVEDVLEDEPYVWPLNVSV